MLDFDAISHQVVVQLIAATTMPLRVLVVVVPHVRSDAATACVPEPPLGMWPKYPLSSGYSSPHFLHLRSMVISARQSASACLLSSICIALCANRCWSAARVYCSAILSVSQPKMAMSWCAVAPLFAAIVAPAFRKP
jgi:hypothetical protein